ncbi:protein of unknown function [Agrobacterium pusense]|jgi:hypothetical protein|uniref:Uncharacterized protein n=1 Tax=Agrobacterium pusense TaxID=648995 RepID=U4Q0X5_9HYPH|nr:protein of unknown function [Agrobacterium pusense]
MGGNIHFATRQWFCFDMAERLRDGAHFVAEYALPAGLAANDLLLHVTNRPAQQPDEPLFVCVRMPLFTQQDNQTKGTGLTCRY